MTKKALVVNDSDDLLWFNYHIPPSCIKIFNDGQTGIVRMWKLTRNSETYTSGSAPSIYRVLFSVGEGAVARGLVADNHLRTTE